MHHLSTRIAENIGINFRTGLTLTSPPFSQIRNHVSEEQLAHQNCNIKKEQFKMISKAQSKFYLNIKESLFIKILNPSLKTMHALNLKIF